MAIWDKFPFADGIHHERDVLDQDTRRIGQVVVLVQLESMSNVAHKGDVT